MLREAFVNTGNTILRLRTYMKDGNLVRAQALPHVTHVAVCGRINLDTQMMAFHKRCLFFCVSLAKESSTFSMETSASPSPSMQVTPWCSMEMLCTEVQ